MSEKLQQKQQKDVVQRQQQQEDIPDQLSDSDSEEPDEEMFGGTADMTWSSGNNDDTAIPVDRLAATMAENRAPSRFIITFQSQSLQISTRRFLSCL